MIFAGIVSFGFDLRPGIVGASPHPSLAVRRVTGHGCDESQGYVGAQRDHADRQVHEPEGGSRFHRLFVVWQTLGYTGDSEIIGRSIGALDRPR